MKTQGFIFGIALGDAMGVPVEFMSRKHLKTSPVVDMRAFGTHHQPQGTWSDDTSLAFCLVEELIEGFDLLRLGNRFCRWYNDAYWSTHGYIFDVGVSTRNAIDRLQKGVSPLHSGESDEYSNGNGSLMRILPLAYYVKNRSIADRFALVKQVSGITHAHIRSVIGCFFAIEYLIALMKGKEKYEAYLYTQNMVRDYLASLQVKTSELELYNRILFDDITHTPEEEIFSSGYIVHTLEACLWSFLTTTSFADAVLKGINLGDDTDTIGSVTAAWAGYYYGFEAIPQAWVDGMQRKDDIIDLSQRFAQKFF